MEVRSGEGNQNPWHRSGDWVRTRKVAEAVKESAIRESDVFEAREQQKRLGCTWQIDTFTEGFSVDRCSGQQQLLVGF